MKIFYMMKRVFAVAAAALVLAVLVASKAGAVSITREQIITEPTGGSPSTTQGLLYLPDDYATSGKSYPLIVQLPGVGEQGTNINLLLNSGTMSWRIENGMSPSAVNPVDGKTYKFIVYTPQGPASSWGWQAVPHLKTIIPDLESKYRIDTSRVYITGYSAGGWGAWTTTEDTTFLQSIAALAPVSSAAARNAATVSNAATYNLPVWSIVGDQDSFLSNSQTYTSVINALNPVIPAKLTVLPGVGHSAWVQAYDPSWRSGGMNLYEWFLQYTRGGSTTPGNNIPSASLATSGATVAPATITLSATASDSDGTISKVQFYNGATLLGSDTSAPYTYSATNLAVGTYSFTAKATDNKGAVGTSSAKTVVVTGTGQGPTPYNVNPAVIPGTIQAENYDIGGQNVAYYDSTSGNTGGAYRNDNVDVEKVLNNTVTDVGWTTNGEWLGYTVTVGTSGIYKLTANISTPNAGKTIAVQMDGTTVGTVTTINTGGWQAYKTVVLNNVSLAAGTHFMKLVFGTGSTTDAGKGLNLDYVKFDLVQAQNTAPVVSLATSGATVAPATITLSATASDSDGTISKVQFYNGATLLSSDTSAPYTYAASGLAAGTYSFTAKATDNAGAVTTSAAKVVTVTAGPVTTPYGGTAAVIPGTIQAENYDLGGQNIAYYDTTSGNTGGAYRSDNVDVEKGSVTDVGWITDTEWLKYTVNVTTTGVYNISANIATPNAGKTITVQVDGTTVGTITTVNTSWWQTYKIAALNNVSLTAGTHVITLRFATGSSSNPDLGFNLDYLKFALAEAGNASPAITLNSPLDAAVYTTPATVTLSATASDSDGTISKVQFYNGATLLSSDTSSPYSYTWNSVGIGSYTLTAKATDNDGATTTSNTVHITVNQPTQTKPVVAITAPHEGDQFIAPATINIAATASEVGGTITRVDFYNGTNLMSSDKTAPYAITRTNVAKKTFSVTAVAFDANGSSTTSDPVKFSVVAAANIPPTVSAGTDQTITLPTNSVTLSGSASDSDGSIASYAWTKVSGGSATISSPSAAVTTVKGLVQGTYVFRLTAKDNGGITASDDVTVTVNSQSTCSSGTVRTLTPPNGNGGMSINGANYKPGDTIVLNAKDKWTYLYTSGLTGTANCPITITNAGGTAHLQNGIVLHNATYVNIDGSGVSGTQYGIEVSSPAPATVDSNFSWRRSVAINIDGHSAHIEVNNVYLHDTLYGIVAKQDIVCDANYNYPNWTMDDLHIHDNKIEHMNQEGMYLGSTDPAATSRSTVNNDPNHCESYTFTSPVTIKLNSGNLGTTANYYKNGTLIGSGASYSWTNVPTGTYTLTATNGSKSAKPFTMTVVSGGTALQTNQIVFGTDKDNIIVVPEHLGNVRIYNNVVNSTQRSGIQLSGAAEGKSAIYNNHVTGAGYEINKDQGAGIWVGGESKDVEVYGNYIRNTFKDNIISYGIGTVNIHDNDISGAGVLPQDKNQAGTCGITVTNCTYPYGANSIHLSTRTTNPKANNPWPSFIVRNNTVGTAQSKNVGADKGSEQFAATGNYVCNSGTVSIESTISWSSNCSGLGSTQTVTTQTETQTETETVTQTQTEVTTQTETESQTASIIPPSTSPDVISAPVDDLTTFVAATPTAPVAAVGTVTANVLNVRATPNGPVVAKVTKGTTVNVGQSQGTWTNVTLSDGTSAWVATQYLAVAATSSTPIVSSRTGAAATVTANVLNVRAVPNGTVITKIVKGTPVAVAGSQGTWTNITLSDGTSAWVATQYLAVTAAPIVSSATAVTVTGAGSATVTANVLNVRATPNGTVVGKVTAGMTGTVISTTSDPWYYVQFADGSAGYVNKTYLTVQ